MHFSETIYFYLICLDRLAEPELVPDAGRLHQSTAGRCQRNPVDRSICTKRQIAATHAPSERHHFRDKGSVILAIIELQNPIFI